MWTRRYRARFSSYVSETKRYFLHHPLPGNRHLPHRVALVAAGHVGNQ